MVSVPKMLLVSTPSDYSIELFQAKAASLIQPTIINYGEISEKISDQFDYIYLRDPFNHPNYDKEQTKMTVDNLTSRYNSAYWVDKAKSYEDLLFEDKWRQYQLFKETMPPTSLLDRLLAEGKIIKKRISARAIGIYFRQSDLPPGHEPNDYIVQPRIDIERELRVYMIGNKIIKPAVYKTSKTPDSKVKIADVANELPAEVTRICESVYVIAGLDFAGLDIAQTPDGCYLLEVNRSCQFKGYQHLTGVNLAVELNKYLVKNT